MNFSSSIYVKSVFQIKRFNGNDFELQKNLNAGDTLEYFLKVTAVKSGDMTPHAWVTFNKKSIILIKMSISNEAFVGLKGLSIACVIQKKLRSKYECHTC